MNQVTTCPTIGTRSSRGLEGVNGSAPIIMGNRRKLDGRTSHARSGKVTGLFPRRTRQIGMAVPARTPQVQELLMDEFRIMDPHMTGQLLSINQQKVRVNLKECSLLRQLGRLRLQSPIQNPRRWKRVRNGNERRVRVHDLNLLNMLILKSIIARVALGALRVTLKTVLADDNTLACMLSARRSSCHFSNCL